MLMVTREHHWILFNNRRNDMDYKAQAQDAIKGIEQLGILGDAITAKETGDMGGLAYMVGMALNTRDPIKWGLLFAVGDALDAA